MSKKHDERKCVRSLSKVCRFEGNQIIANSATLIGIHRWGMIDYLVKYCGYRFYKTRSKITASNIRFSDDDINSSVREAKKARKEHKLTNKKK